MKNRKLGNCTTRLTNPVSSRGRFSLFRFGMVFVLFVGVIIEAVSPRVLAHDWEDVRFVLLTWANGLVNSDRSMVDEVLHSDFPNRENYFNMVELAWPGNRYVELRYARFEMAGETARVENVVVIEDRGTFKQALTVGLIKQEDSWSINSFTVEPELPDELTARPLPEQEFLLPVSVSLRDADTGDLIAARVHVRDDAGMYWPPDGHMRYINTMWRDVGGDVMIGDTTYAYVESDFSLRVPEGQYELLVARGLEYEPQTIQFEVRPSGANTIDVNLKRWSNMQSQGWYSGDTHVHFLDPQSALLELRGEDLNVVNVLATKWGELITNVEHFSGAPSNVSSDNEIVYVNEELRHAFLGHTVLLSLQDYQGYSC